MAAYGAQSILIGPTGTAPNQRFGITRYNADGSLDTTFGTAGVTKTAFAGTDAVPSAVAVVGDKILVAGTATTPGAGSQFAIARYNADGSLDTTFGTNGTTLVGFGAALTNDVLRSLVVAKTGRIYLGGRSDAAGHGNADFAVAALTANGSPDAGFGSTGHTLLDVAQGDDSLTALAVQANGSVVVAGSATVSGITEVALARLLSSGLQDLRFGTKGLSVAPVGGVFDAATSIALGAKGEIVLGGVTATGTAAAPGSDFLVQRYTANGKLDRSFGKAGSATTTFGQPSAVTQVIVLADGSVIASGRTGAALGGPLDVAVARYTVRGALNTGFNGTGKVVINLATGIVASPAAALGAAFDQFVASQQGVIAVTPGGEILVAGNSGANTVEADLVAIGVDLVAAVVAPAATGVGGLKGTTTVTVTDKGTDRATGKLVVLIQFATDAAGSNAVTARSLTQKANLLPGKSKTVRVSFNYPTGLPAGGYFLITLVTGGTSTAAELDGANNRAASAAAVTINPAVIVLSGSTLTAKSPVAAGTVVPVSLTLTNAGNVVAKGRIAVALYLSTDGAVAGATPLAVPPVTLSLAPNKPRVIKLSATLPAAVAAGTYTLLAVVDAGHTLGPADLSDATTLVVGTIPVTVG